MVSDKRLEVRQPHELGVLPLVNDVVDAVLAVVEDDEVVLVVAGRHLVPVGIANTLMAKKKRNIQLRKPCKRGFNDRSSVGVLYLKVAVVYFISFLPAFKNNIFFHFSY